MDNNEEIIIKAKKLWGNDLHNNKSAPIHCNQLADIFKEQWSSALRGEFLEIGCGGGADLAVFSEVASISNITAIDLGSNITNLAKKYKSKANINIFHGDALALEFEDNSFDVIYSFGIFHHTSDPIKCISEAKRVLRREGKLFLYLYGAHEDLWFKRLGILLENLIMQVFKYLPYSIQNFMCILLSPLCWVLFSVPAIFLRRIGFSNFATKIPFYFGSHPFALIGDLKDRLLSPINHRFTKLEMENILSSLGFINYEVIKKASGLYILAVK